MAVLVILEVDGSGLLKAVLGLTVAVEGRLVVVVVSSLSGPGMAVLWLNMEGIMIVALPHNNAEGRGGAAKVCLCYEVVQ